VLSLENEPGLVDAVRSLDTQSEAVEIVVVNSGGGDPAARLFAAGLDVPVVNRLERLYPGAVRNIGIEHTLAPYVSFLAADCIALPDWVAARLREHRGGAAAVASCPANAYPESLSAWASLLLLHNRLLPVGPVDSRLFYGLSYERLLFERFGLFAEDLRAGEDTEFNARFRGKVVIVRAPDVRTAHRYPTTTAALLRDAYRRGRLQAAMLGRIEETRPQGARVAGRAALNVFSSIRPVLRMRGSDRAQMLMAWPIVAPAGVVYALGALTAYFRRYEGYRPAADAVLRSHNAAGK
jgi:glycosyltransferase involved in cell wall biosynthesis